MNKTKFLKLIDFGNDLSKDHFTYFNTEFEKTMI